MANTTNKQEHSPLVCACHHELRGAPRRLSFVLLECSFLALLQLPASIYGMRSACAALDPSTTILLLASSRQPLYIRVTIRPRAHPRLMQWSGRWCGHHYDLFRLGITPETTELVSPRWRPKKGDQRRLYLETQPWRLRFGRKWHRLDEIYQIVATLY